MKTISSGIVLLPLLLTLLAGCSQRPAVNATVAYSLSKPAENHPAALTTCSQIWQSEKPAALQIDKLPYWLQLMACAEQLPADQAWQEAYRWPVDSWVSAFRQGILLSNTDKASQQHKAITILDNYSSEYPPEIRSLIHFWRSAQLTRLALAESYNRYALLQKERDGQLNVLQHQRNKLRQQLSDTQHKLKRLTDIERQLSRRKSLDMIENSQIPIPSSTGGKAKKATSISIRGADNDDSKSEITAGG